MFNWIRRKQEKGCECEDYCPCKEPHHGCEDCIWYRFIDSGYGYCIAVPGVVGVPWCRIVCSLFKLRDHNIEH